jgi:hypothetical protein
MLLSGQWWLWAPLVTLFVAVLAFTLLGLTAGGLWRWEQARVEASLLEADLSLVMQRQGGGRTSGAARKQRLDQAKLVDAWYGYFQALARAQGSTALSLNFAQEPLTATVTGRLTTAGTTASVHQLTMDLAWDRTDTVFPGPQQDWLVLYHPGALALEGWRSSAPMQAGLGRERASGPAAPVAYLEAIIDLSKSQLPAAWLAGNPQEHLLVLGVLEGLPQTLTLDLRGEKAGLEAFWCSTGTVATRGRYPSRFVRTDSPSPPGKCSRGTAPGRGC